MKKLSNPFLVYGYESPEYFCDREVETAQLISDLNNGWNITLFSPRRMGKTGLIKNVFYRLQHEAKDAVCIYVDIFGTNDLSDFVQTFGTAILTAMLSKGEKALRRAMQFFAAWRPVVSMDPMTGEPSVSVTLESRDSTVDLKQIFDLMKDSGKQIYVAIDEFQQIMSYPEKGVEAQLRSYIQFLHNAHFIFSGSKRHLMADIFLSPNRPFFQSTRLMELQAIDEAPYYTFAGRFFRKQGHQLDKDVFHYFYNMLEGHTWYVQSVLKQLYADGEDVVTERQADEAIRQLVQDNNAYYETIFSLLPEKQQKLLDAIAHEGHVSAPNSGQFIARYRLTSASSVSSSLKSLTDKELVYKSPAGYQVYDRFFGLWLSRR